MLIMLIIIMFLGNSNSGVAINFDQFSHCNGNLNDGALRKVYAAVATDQSPVLS
jgi:hypothetical protein